MIRLKNIKKNANEIECLIYPEDSKENGNIKIDTSTNEIISYELPNGYGWCKKHLAHAQKTLIELNAMNEIPQEKLVMWG